jgi:hypothetical protein
MRRLVLLILLVLALAVPGPASAQNDTRLERVVVNVWPEYDAPDVLVFYQLQLAGNTELPAQMSLRIPHAAGGPSAVAYSDVNGQLLNLEFSTRTAGEWDYIDFTTPSLIVQVEYYDPSLNRQGDQRHFEYTWPGDYGVNTLLLSVQSPVNSSNMRFSSEMSAAEPGPEGVTLYTHTIEDVSAGTPLTLSMDYQKPDDALMTTSQPVQMVEPVSPGTTGRTSMIDFLPWALGGLGVLLIAGGAWWYWRSSRSTPAEVRKRHTPNRRPVETSPASTSDGAPVYCHQCGKRAKEGDVFCRTCGTKLRLE